MIQTQVIVPVTTVTTMTLNMTREGYARKERLTAEGKCLGCERVLRIGEQTRRGQCGTCYHNTRRKLNADPPKITEQELIRGGFLLPASPGGRHPTNPYTRKLAGQE